MRLKDVLYLVKRPCTLKSRVRAGDSELEQKESHPAMTEQPPEDQLQIRPRDPQPPVSFQVSRLHSLLEQNRNPEQRKRPHRREMITARPRFPARDRMHDPREEERQQHNHRPPEYCVLPETQPLLRGDDGVDGERFAHRFVPEMAVPPPQSVRLGDVSEKRRPGLERRVEDPDCDERADGVCAADCQRGAAVGVEGDYGSQPEISERECAVEECGSHVRFRRVPVAGFEIFGVEAGAVADV